MKCAVCKHEIDPNAAVCGTCGFPILNFVGQKSEQFQEIQDQLAREYKGKLLQDLSLSVRTYTWKEAAGELKEDQQKDVVVARGPELLEKGRVFCPTSFARTVSEKTISVQYVLERSGKTRTGTAQLEAPTDVSFWTVGTELTDDLTLRLLLKSDAACNASEEIAILEE